MTFFVPNNDLDAKGGDPAQIASIRTRKFVQPRLIENEAPVLYVWEVQEERGHAETIVATAEEVFQFGRGIDPAWARGELVDDARLAALLDGYPGVLHLPGAGKDEGVGLLTPVTGSFRSLVARFSSVRLEESLAGRKTVQLFQNPPKPFFRLVRYGRHRPIRVFRFLQAENEAKAAPQRLTTVSALVQRIRDQAAARLRGALEGYDEEIERVLIGRKADGSNGGPIEDRVRIVPLPSIGHDHADHGIRRIAVEIPGGSRLSSEDVAWAFEGLAIHDETTGVIEFTLAAEEKAPMLGHYQAPARRFQSATPLALPEVAQRRRIEPARLTEEAKGAEERLEEERRAIASVRQALRHAGIHAEAASIHVQREPFHRHGELATKFANGTRFSKHSLWHVDITFRREIEGPIVLGNGRFLGLGVMYPVKSRPIRGGLWAFSVEGEVREAPALVRAFRRAVMARVSVRRPTRALEPFFSGHQEDGTPLRTENSEHLAFQWDPLARRLLVIAPHRIDRREPQGSEWKHLGELDSALKGFVDLRAGRAGRFRLEPVAPSELEGYERYGSSFVSLNAYRVSRHAKKMSAHEILEEDLVRECSLRGLPKPRVTVLSAEGVPGHGLVGRARVDFETRVEGPLLLGRDRFLGGGLFVPEEGDGSL